MKLKQNKFFIFIFSFVLLAGLTLPTQASAQTTQNVQLVYSKTMSKDNHIFAYGYVQTLPSEGGSVELHYQVGENVWKDINATYVGVKDNAYGLWYFEIDGGQDPMSDYSKSGKDFRFAVKYTTSSGQVYWDNNNGNEFKVSGGYSANFGRYVLGSSNLVLANANSWTSDNTYFTGQIALKNSDYNKVVKVRYSCDNWVTYKETSAIYQFSEPNDVEIWSFRGEGPANAKDFKFAISYTVNGQTYWDNNFNSNYTVNVSESLNNPGVR
ncbi:carbohydrate-binding protein [Clostridium cibarium]|uniref:CBM21 domain-containing protein n=1 Tax=Clostridium cibarium TaxID=2762247 RepID=A0ABR8PV81_9CLOT|nr:carbohydrate-binding protein [Clostridium cibarium]MBD7912039.1 hypothetical protein [Clostridium cibarium]